jgi:hypothetical protein
MAKKNNPLEFYETPKGLTTALLQRLQVYGRVIEPCAGDHAITDVLKNHGLEVLTCDIDPTKTVDYVMDSAVEDNWGLLLHADWVVSNPPFSRALEILKNAYDHAEVGVAMLLRLSFLEPCEPRNKWLVQHPPQRIIVLPRVSFDGKGNDTVTCAWFIWYKKPNEAPPAPPIQVVLRDWI